MIRSTTRFANPLVYGVVATIIVLFVGGLAASHLTVRDGNAVSSMVEKVAVTEDRYAPAPQPKLEMNVPHGERVASQGSTSSAPSSSALAPLIARTAKVSLYVGNVDRTAAMLASIARRNDGDVFSSDISNGDGSTAEPNGTMEVRVPAQRFDAAMNAIARAGTVRERSTSAEDLTGDITDSDARLRNLRSTEADIRRIMARSGSVSQVMDAEMQLSQVREQIETLESDLKDMRTRVAYATIDIDLQAETASAPVSPTAASQIASAWHAALAALGGFTVGIIAFVLWVAVFVPYLLAAALVVWLLVRKLRPAFH
ncbi:MAG TPA: DUF4349 domain-containing protein [Candidatus Baltobacteraceae bacterium]|nr:DUF4349 domain-containing protein [Candidatus Baltobacteraceae bacterium]